MKTGRMCVIGYKLKNMIHNFFSLYYKYLIFGLVVLVTSSVVGIFVALKFSDNIAIENIFDQNLLKFLAGDTSVFGLFLIYSLQWTFLSLFAILFSFSSVSYIINIIIFAIKSYKFGFNITVFIISFSFMGIVNSILFLIPFYLISLLLYNILISVCAKRALLIKKFGINRSFNANFFKLTFFIFSIMLVTNLILCVLLNFIKLTIITI